METLHANYVKYALRAVINGFVVQHDGFYGFFYDCFLILAECREFLGFKLKIVTGSHHVVVLIFDRFDSARVRKRVTPKINEFRRMYKFGLICFPLAFMVFSLGSWVNQMLRW